MNSGGATARLWHMRFNRRAHARDYGKVLVIFVFIGYSQNCDETLKGFGNEAISPKQNTNINYNALDLSCIL
ncbi:unnamed protein product [Leptidea sinapis]|uniref:Uncharacterized protein n=1 Tax=Leptidea sinapis TaxID=189913 RepID=A0A5E4QKP4_9NEOP|nr:unnamed protein product [Leptidea sinapis]